MSLELILTLTPILPPCQKRRGLTILNSSLGAALDSKEKAEVDEADPGEEAADETEENQIADEKDEDESDPEDTSVEQDQDNEEGLL